jgi:glutathione synthase/RimK-type ligase-like ATP-grasp enzyme
MNRVLEFSEYLDQTNLENALGILGDRGKRSKFGEQTAYFKRLLLEAKRLGINAYVFTDFDRTGAKGWTFDGSNWTESHRGLPAVFYDRSFRKKSGSVDGMSNTRTLASFGCTPINSADFRKTALDKHRMYSELINEDLGGLGIPVTEKYSKNRLIQFLQKRQSCIIKPRFGSGGRGIIKVSKSDNSYEINSKGNLTRCSESELVELISNLKKRMGMSKRLFIIQECIALPKYNDSVFDIRVIYQRGPKGSPLRTGMAARIAAPNKIAANLHQGGSRETLSEVLEALFNQSLNGPIAKAIRDGSRKVFKKLNEKCGPIGEIGIDFLIDQSGRLHLIEVNSIPGRSLFKVLPDIRETSIRRPVEYAHHLLNKKSRD